MDPPDRIPAARFSLPKSSTPYHQNEYMGCRHGLSLLIDKFESQAVVWDPLTGEDRIVAFPPGFNNSVVRRNYCAWHGAVLCVDAEDGHVHGDCFSSPFELVLVCADYDTPAFCSVYDSASGVWGNIFSTMTITAGMPRLKRPSILVGNALFWLICLGEVLVFDFEMQSFGLIEKPVENSFLAGELGRKGRFWNCEHAISANMLSWSNNLGIKS
uniref:F-box protein AT5G49610-like beta-propeller domain-containing protein n=1 Tax=Aegilops tauschii TaxID=37682 RepID=M8C2Q0_AEGTA